jgi:formiminotetrahydrofolate cyclodeaminase
MPVPDDEVAVQGQAQLDSVTTQELLERLSSSAPIPGGGSASALAGAMGTGLVAMVAALTVGRPAYADADRLASELGASATELRDELLDLANQDADAYDAVVRARRLPRATDEERAARSAAIADATRLAAEIPMRTAGVALDGLALASQIAPIGNRNAVSDAGVAALLLAGAVRGALLNVRINLPSLDENDELRVRAERESARIADSARQLEAAAIAAVETRLG